MTGTRVEIETGLDTTEITQVIPDRSKPGKEERLELIGREITDDALVTSQLRQKGRAGGRRDGRDRPDRRDRRSRPRSKERDRPRETDKRSERSAGPRSQRPKKAAARPRPPRLRPGKTHRLAYLETLGDEQRPVAEKLVEGGMPGLRAAIDADNAKRKAQGQPEVPTDRLVAIAEELLPRLTDAEWNDRADAALARVDDLDLRDLRSVVVAADDHARTDETRALAAELRTKLTDRVDRAHNEWLAELDTALGEKRIARVLNLSSRPPKAGSPLPTDLAERMVAATNEALGPDSPSGRWITLLDALAFAPIRSQVRPTGIPAEPTKELVAKVEKLSSRLPNVAAAFGKGPPRSVESGRERPAR